ncbi:MULTISPECIES: phage tail length tape measure family protein [unclassified Pseudomonas]|uniref:phage tail length tape measure family protein n=1 Tax=unclassified Pseudomonas TaxID=196821 RepID=UPI001473370E|nr:MULTISPECIES: phage tail length tape measure family protein [unclassified Pseudomonas]NMX91985.1 prothage tail length tape measure [Pseudomonas sp. WS 5086]NMY46933.1 prothage tail length tape measure [Pseudomonas sp. WS 5027]
MTQTSRLVLEIDSRDAEQKAADTRKALEALEGAGLRVKPAMDKARTGMESVGKGAEKATKSVQDQRDEIDQLLGSINPLTRKMNELEKQELALAKAHKAGKIETDTYTEYQQKINATRNELTRFSDSLTRTGNTAKQTAAALRGVPAQFTDIAVSLQGGQAPLTVLLQQGGQLKDMFGGVGPAAKALGGYVLGLINPFTIAAAAVGALGLALYDAEKEASEFNKALFSGSANTGKTALGLATLAKDASSLSGSFSEAKAAVIALAGVGRLSEVQFSNLAKAAVSIGEFTGKSAADVAKSLGDMGNNATESAKKLSSQYGLLSSSQYEVIAALDRQGKTQEALDLLSETLNKNAEARLAKYKASLSGLEKAWDDVGTSISNAYRNVRSELFPDAGKEIEIIERILKTRKDGGLAGAVSTGLSKLNGALGLDDGENDDSTAALERRLAMLKTGIALNQQNAKAEGDATRKNQERIEADGKWSALAKKELSDQAKLVKDIADARKLGVEAGKSQAEIDKVVADIQAKYDKAQPKAKAYTEDAGMKALDAARQTQAVLLQQNASLNTQGIATEKVGTQAQALIRWEQQLADIKGKKTLTADQKSLLASQDLITAQLKKNVALEREAQISRDIQQAQKDQVQLLTLTGRLREANSLKSSLDDAAQMAEYERQGNTEAMKRLETLIKIRDVNLKASQKPGTIEGVSQAPQVTGIDASVGGAYSEIQRLNEESAKVDAWRAMELEKQKAYLDLKAINEETYAERVNNINQQGRDNQAKIERAKNSAVLTSSADFFGNMTALSQSGNKKLAAVGKAAAIAQATIQGYVAVQNALAVQPYPLGMALAVSAGVAAAANVAAIAGIGFSGGGYTGPGGVNEVAGTVHKGEVVWSQKDIQRYGGVAAVEALRNGNVSAIPSVQSAKGGGAMPSMSSAPPQINIRVSGDGSSGSASATAGYEQMGQAVLATVRSEMPKVARAVIQQEKGQNGLLDPNNRRSAA